MNNPVRFVDPDGKAGIPIPFNKNLDYIKPNYPGAKMGKLVPGKNIDIMRELFIFCSFIFACVSFLSFTQKESNSHPIEELKVINPNLYPVLDTILKIKDDTRIFKTFNQFIVEFGEDSERPDLIFIRVKEKIDYFYPNILGYFDYKDNTFVVRSDFIDSTIFRKTKNYRFFDFSLPPMKYTAEGNPILGQLNNFAVWSMRYKHGEFRMLSFFTSDKNDDWFDRIEEEYNQISLE